MTEKINLAKQELSEIGLQKNEYEQLNSKLDHLIELTEKLNKTDWFSILIGSIISTCLSLAFSTDNVKAV